MATTFYNAKYIKDGKEFAFRTTSSQVTDKISGKQQSTINKETNKTIKVLNATTVRVSNDPELYKSMKTTDINDKEASEDYAYSGRKLFKALDAIRDSIRELGGDYVSFF